MRCLVGSEKLEGCRKCNASLTCKFLLFAVLTRHYRIGGWPGAWIAQQTLRHKSSKLSFQIEFWLCVVANLAVLLWYALGRAGSLPDLSM
ncbi:MAG: DUF1294 domain-containing protein [Steroidobacteraceae bacterium]